MMHCVSLKETGSLFRTGCPSVTARSRCSKGAFLTELSSPVLVFQFYRPDVAVRHPTRSRGWKHLPSLGQVIDSANESSLNALTNFCPENPEFSPGIPSKNFLLLQYEGLPHVLNKKYTSSRQSNALQRGPRASPGTCDYPSLLGKADLCGCDYVKNVDMGRFPELSGWAHGNIRVLIRGKPEVRVRGGDVRISRSGSGLMARRPRTRERGSF